MRVSVNQSLSMQGAYFSTDLTLKVGELVDVFVEIPEEMSGKETAEHRFVAKVIHLETDRPVAGQTGRRQVPVLRIEGKQTASSTVLTAQPCLI
jgi:hypothetical protein